MAETKPSGPKKILLVEDEPTLQRILGSVLVDAGHKVESVGTAEAAIERLEAESVDLVLSDKNLPGQSGLDLLRKVRELEAERDQVYAFILVTGYPSRDSALEVLEGGGDGYLVKPFRSLVDAVSRIESTLTLALPERRRGTELARKMHDLLTGTGEASVDCALLLLDEGDDRARIEARLRQAAIPVMQDARAVRGDAVVAISGRVDDLESFAQVRPDAALLLASGGASFADLVALVTAGGGRVVDPSTVPGT